MPLYDAHTMLGDAVRNNYALAAFNINSLDSLQAVLWAAEAENSPVIIQVLHFAEKYVRDTETYLKAVQLYADRCKVPVLLQHDHCSSVEEALRAVDAGYASVMFDGSALSYEENVRETREVVAYAHCKNVWVEAELGYIPSLDDQTFDDHVCFTSPELVGGFIASTDCDSLAVSVGTAHGGVSSDGYLTMDFERLEQLVAVRPDYPFVLHGAASMPDSLREYVNLYGGEIVPTHICSERDIAKACRSGIHKANMDVDNWMAYTGALRQFFAERPDSFFMHEYLDFARNAFEQEVRHKIRNVVRSSGMAKDFAK